MNGSADLATGRPATTDEWWDLASLTRTLVTLPEVPRLVDNGRLAPEQPLAECWDKAAGHPIGEVTVADVLSHRAGLPATAALFRTLAGPKAVVDATLRADLTGQRVAVYSDLGFLLLGALVEDLTGDSLTELARRRSGLRMGRAPGSAAATEHCTWRQRLIVGESTTRMRG